MIFFAGGRNLEGLSDQSDNRECSWRDCGKIMHGWEYEPGHQAGQTHLNSCNSLVVKKDMSRSLGWAIKWVRLFLIIFL